MVDEFWKNDIFTDHGLPVCIRIPTVCRAILKQLQNQILQSLVCPPKQAVGYHTQFIRDNSTNASNFTLFVLPRRCAPSIIRPASYSSLCF